jgi:hypothetical protein
MNMDKTRIKVAVGKDDNGWHERFADALESLRQEGYCIDFDVLNLEANNWFKIVAPYPVVVWKTSYMGPQAAAQFAAKIYTLQNLYGKIVLPNFNSIWHFENKNAQKYIFEALAVPTPPTVVSFDYQDAIAILEQEEFPLVFKKAYGAASQNVELIRSMKQALSRVTRVFSHQLWRDSLEHTQDKKKSFLLNLTQRWLWWKVLDYIMGRECGAASVYWQRFIPGNAADLRITVIGDMYAVGFWRKNRINDFRASGSGMIDYKTPVPLEVVRYCRFLNKTLDFDSMAYDILFRDGQFLIVEMSYGYVDKAVWNAPGHYRFDGTDSCNFIEGHHWPQEFWIRWMSKRLESMCSKNQESA